MKNRPTSAHLTPAGARLLAPDVMRGGLLLLIALANVPYWTTARENADSTVDIVLSRLVAAFVDGRCYPVFAVLFGFGLATLAERYSNALLPYRHAKSRLMRRLWVLLLIGFIHALVFMGDILGPYAVVGLLVTPLVIRAKSRTIAYVAGVVYLLELLSLPAYSLLIGGVNADPRTSLVNTFQPLAHLENWAISLLVLAPVSVTPMLLVGVLLQRFSVIARYPSRPWQVRAVAWWAPPISLALCTVAGLWTWDFTGDAVESLLSIPNNVAGVVMGAGYLAACATWCRRWEGLALTRLPTPLRWLRAVGQRSLTCYVLQTVGFVVLLAPWGPLAWGTVLPYWATLTLAAAIWGATAALAVALDRLGKPGPLDALLRRLSTPRQ